MKKSALLLVLFCIGYLPLLSSFVPEYLQADFKGEYKPVSSEFSKKKDNNLMGNQDAIIRNYDVIHYDISLDWYNVMKATADTNESRYWNGTIKIRAKLLADNINYIELDAALLKIDEVLIDNIALENLPICNSNNILKIEFPKVYNTNDTIDISIKYQYVNLTNIGFYIYNKHFFVDINPFGNNDSLFTLERIAYTQSEPKDTRYWFPCNDQPHDKATVGLTMKLPKEYTSASVGILSDQYIVEDSAFFIWSSRDAMPTYLISANASIFHTFSDWFTNNNNENIEVKYYVWEQDYNNEIQGYNPIEAFNQTTEMMQYFSGLFFDYPFQKYGMVAVYPFGGGMEHQTLTTIDRDWFRESYCYSGIAHELAHQWLGDYITCSNWKDLWINEGGATWSTAMWFLNKYGYESYLKEILTNRNKYINRGGLYFPPIYDLPDNILFIEALTYCKASLFYNMTYQALGYNQQLSEYNFNLILRELFSRHKLSSIDLEQFKAVCKELNPEFPISWDTWFDQWIVKAGHPEFELSSDIIPENNQYSINTKITQVQIGMDVPEDFQVPVYIIYKYEDNTADTSMVYMTQKEQEYKKVSNRVPMEIGLDTIKLLCRVVNTSMLSVQTFDKIDNSVYPNIINSGDNFKIAFNANSEVEIKIIDILGREIKNLFSGYIGNQSATMEFTSQGLESGIYFIKIYSENISSNLKLIVR